MNEQEKKPPRHLRAPTRRWWTDVVNEWALEEHHQRLLTACAESWDRAGEARESISHDGLTFRDRFGQLRPNPAAEIERDQKILFARLLRELNLDVSASEDERVTRLPRVR